MAGNITTISTTYVLVVPFTAQSHVMPLMKLPQLLVNHGRFKVTFINFECIHRRLIDSILSPNGEQKGLATNFDHGICLASVPDGLTTAHQKDVEELYNAVYNVFPGLLERLIKNIHESGESMTCLIANETIATTIEVAERKRILRAAFAPPVALVKVLCHSIPTLTQKGIIDDNGDFSIIDRADFRIYISLSYCTAKGVL
ncbi:hypothetical protein Scep_017022 [Stephania cephalantha]|uniref:Uncharacterized protein n=1 Tax=Stephania cephalantha TaxID=152367 RepID=A0AAP0NUP1_9MAGN